MGVDLRQVNGVQLRHRLPRRKPLGQVGQAVEPRRMAGDPFNAIVSRPAGVDERADPARPVGRTARVARLQGQADGTLAPHAGRTL